MSEAIISRSMNSTVELNVSNETKQLMGLKDTATLDDCIQTLGYRDSNYATIVVQILDYDGTPVQDGVVKMTDAAGINYSYNCNSLGKTLFKTNAGKANFVNDEPYLDIISETKAADCVVGSVTYLTFNRNYRSYSESVMLPTGNYQFSNRINNFWAYVVGGGGSSSTYHVRNCGIGFRKDGSWWKQSGETVSGGYNGGNGYANSALVNHVNGTVYQSILGSGGSSPSTSNSKSGSTKRTTSSINGVTLSLQNGRSGGTSSFGGLISAAGGYGGTDTTSYQYASTQNSYGGAAGQGSSYSVTGSCRKWSNGNGASATLHASTYGSSGGAGNVFVTNFNYRT